MHLILRSSQNKETKNCRTEVTPFAVYIRKENILYITHTEILWIFFCDDLINYVRCFLYKIVNITNLFQNINLCCCKESIVMN